MERGVGQIKNLLIALVLMFSVGNAKAISPACIEIGEVAELIGIAKNAGMPKLIMVAGVKVDKTGMYAMDTFALNLIEAAYSCNHFTVNKFVSKTVKACEKLMAKKDAFEWMGSK